MRSSSLTGMNDCWWSTHCEKSGKRRRRRKRRRSKRRRRRRRNTKEEQTVTSLLALTRLFVIETTLYNLE